MNICNMSQEVISKSVTQTIRLGNSLAKHLKAGDIIALSGVFGAGKTYFTKGIAQGLGVKKLEDVNSPSFVLCNIHQGKKLKLYHFDAQRIPKAQELLQLGLTECFNGVCVIEWAEKLAGLELQPNIMYINFIVKGKNKRILTFHVNQKRWNKFWSH